MRCALWKYNKCEESGRMTEYRKAKAIPDEKTKAVPDGKANSHQDGKAMTIVDDKVKKQQPFVKDIS